ncbi:MAG: bifunctional phosphoribosylaminoimidazolecarboxamide formyltransferase/inosine monophosphate cyclohydrolase [Gemmataceae bacterium]
MSERKIRRALLSVYDKMGLVSFAQVLREQDVELISTGGTYRVLVESGLPVTEVSQITGFPEILDGRVKTLHPHIHAALLARRHSGEHMATLERLGIAPIDLVVCNLYPFEAVASQTGVAHEEVIEQIDIGGPTLIRAAAKNYYDVAVVTAPEQYADVAEELRASGGVLTLSTRERLAIRAFRRMVEYDLAIARYFESLQDAEKFPLYFDMSFRRRLLLRYGENPHQHAALYVAADAPEVSLAHARLLGGKELSFNNLLDLDSALRIVQEWTVPAAVIVKHTNPCGAAIGESLDSALSKAFACDPQSAYGGIVGCNREVDELAAEVLTAPGRFLEAILAPHFLPAALEILRSRPKWKQQVRLVEIGRLAQDRPNELDLKRIVGGLLVQTPDAGEDDLLTSRVVTRRQPSEREWDDLRFAWKVVKHVKSNAIVLAREGQTVGIGAGQMSRVDAVRIAVNKAGERARGAVLASDAFFPFRDNVDVAAQAGITAIVQPGGSVRDAESIAACDENGLAMVFTGVRHFKH